MTVYSLEYPFSLTNVIHALAFVIKNINTWKIRLMLISPGHSELKKFPGIHFVRRPAEMKDPFSGAQRPKEQVQEKRDSQKTDNIKQGGPGRRFPSVYHKINVL